MFTSKYVIYQSILSVFLNVFGKLFFLFKCMRQNCCDRKKSSKLNIIGPDNGLRLCRRQTIVWTLAGILFIRITETKFSEILSEIYTFSFKIMHFKMSSAKWWQFCSEPDVLNHWWCSIWWYVSNNAGQSEYALQWRHNGRDHVSNLQPNDCFLNRLFRRRSIKKAPRHWLLCEELTDDLWIPRTNG